MSEGTLWKQYAQALAKENQARNLQRQVLNKEIELMLKDNQTLKRNCSSKDQQLINQRQYNSALQSKIISADRAVYQIYNDKQKIFLIIEKMKRSMQEKQNQLASLKSYIETTKYQQNHHNQQSFKRKQTNQQFVQYNSEKILKQQVRSLKQRINILEASSSYSSQNTDQLNQKNMELEQRLIQLERIIGKQNKNGGELKQSKRSNKSFTTQQGSFGNATKIVNNSYRKAIILNHRNKTNKAQNIIPSLNIQRIPVSPVKLLWSSNQTQRDLCMNNRYDLLK